MPEAKLYDTDLFAWTRTQADALKRRSPNELDWDNLLEEMESLGRSQRHELRNRLRELLSHLLKWSHQVSFRSPSWAATIREQRRQVALHVAQNPSLKSVLTELFDDAWEAAVVDALVETGLARRVFDAAPRLTYEQALTAEVEGLDL